MLNKEGFENIFNLYYQSLCKYLFLFTDDFQLIEDTAQSVFIKLWEEAEKKQITHIKTYLFTCARNTLLNAIRDNRRRKELLKDFVYEELYKDQSDDVIDFEEFSNIVSTAIKQLPPKTQEIYILGRETKMPYKEIASLKSISVKTVENQMSTALKRINQIVKEHYNKLPIIILFTFISFLT